MHPRVAEEWDDVIAVYPDAQYLQNPDRIELALDLADGLYNQARTRVAVAIPAGYRGVGPDGFYVLNGLQLKAGGLPASDATGVGMEGWLLVSFHLIDSSGRSTWRATADPGRGDNLVGYLASVESFLARGCN